MDFWWHRLAQLTADPSLTQPVACESRVAAELAPQEQPDDASADATRRHATEVVPLGV